MDRATLSVDDINNKNEEKFIVPLTLVKLNPHTSRTSEENGKFTVNGKGSILLIYITKVTLERP